MSFVTPPTFAVGDVFTSTAANIYAGDLNAIWGGSWTPYTPTWGIGAGGTAPTLGNGTLNGYYKVIGKLCIVHIYLLTGTTTSCGQGAWTFSLPVNPALNVEQSLQCRSYPTNATTLGTYVGAVVIGAGSTICTPYLPVSGSVCVQMPAQNTNNAATSGTGVPASTTFPFNAGSNMVITGTYETA